MSKQEEAALILKLYELRREEVMRKARDWFVREFHPATIDEFMQVMMSDRGHYLRMVVSYWDMAAALVNEGAISLPMFDKANAEYIIVFGKLEKILPEIRATVGPHFARSLEALIDALPDGRQRVAGARDRLAASRARTGKT